MADQLKQRALSLQALILADHIYQDKASSKYVVAGTFHKLNVAAFPANFGRTIGIFVSICGITGKTDIEIEFIDASNGNVLLRTKSISIMCDNPELPVDFAVEVPPLPLPHAGGYFFRLTAGGNVLGEARIIACGPEE